MRERRQNYAPTRFASVHRRNLIILASVCVADPTLAFRPTCHAPFHRSSYLHLSNAANDGGIGIGIDLGTTFSAVAYLDDDGFPQIVPTTQGYRTMPSVVALDGDAVVVGHDALNTDGAYRHVKRVIGTGGKLDPAIASVVPHVRPSRQGKTFKKNSLPNQLHDAEHFPTFLYSTVEKETNIRPEFISSCLLQSLRLQAEAHTGKTVTRAVIGVPAYFNDAQRQATLDAAAMAGMDKVKLLREPEAAALAYGKLLEQKSNSTARGDMMDDDDDDELVLVLDLGGGTYDVSVLVVGNGVTEIVCTSGNVQLGGADMDRKVSKHLMQLVQRHATDAKTKWSEQAIMSVVRVSEKVRIFLSNNRFANLALPLEESGWRNLNDLSSVLLPNDCQKGDESMLPEDGRSNSTHVLCRFSRKKMEGLCQEELLALLRPMREVAIAGGVLLPGDADPAVLQMALDLEEADKQVFSDFYVNDDAENAVDTTEDELMRQMKSIKKSQQKGRRKAHDVAKNQRKFRAEKSRLQQSNQKVQTGIHGRPLSRVVLVGGTTRMPVIGKLISVVTGVVPQRTVNPDEAVALGCAVHVGVLDGDERIGTVLNPMQAAILRALAKQQGLLDGIDDDNDDDFEFDGEETAIPLPTLQRSEGVSSITFPEPKPPSNIENGSLSYIEFPQSLWERLEWMIPVAAGIASFTTFASVSATFHKIVQWMSSNTWLPESKDDINLQANVVTQVINGPVITSISVLFGTLVSVTVATLHSRQFDIQKSLIIEMQTLRQLQFLLNSKSVSTVLESTVRLWAIGCVSQHSRQFLLDHYDNDTERSDTDPHARIESNLITLLNGCNDLLLSDKDFDARMRLVISATRDLALKLIKQRTNRWLALKALKFPAVHYMTLSLLALGISISFLVATDEADFIFLHGLPVKILWTILMSSFAALAVVLNDLTRPFGGSYRVVSTGK
ncbi:hypothetical protein MPSEU_000719300 [Mayamaea pseudoterrestris]|nr:hypothetical protein MPSEU_000719300 [Mayamaea pseudoterrestris]